MSNYYVLVEICEPGKFDLVLGVFDSQTIPTEEMKGYFGDFSYDENDFSKIEDSGIEWCLRIKTKDNLTHPLMMLSFRLNTIE